MLSGPVLSLAELEKVALEKVSKITREYWMDGAGDNSTVRGNRTAFDRYKIRPRTLRNVKNVDMSVNLLGQKLRIPVGIAPSGWHKMANPLGEAGTARAAKNLATSMAVSMGTSMGASSAAICSPEEIKLAGGCAVKFYQLYIFQNRDYTKALLHRIEKQGYEAIILTVDTAVVGRRISEIRNRPHMPDFLRIISFGSQLTSTVSNEPSAANSHAREDFSIDSSIVWDEIIPWLRKNTRMQIWLKGILTAEDAALAVSYKVDGIIVSNHGGRQLEGCVATIDALPEVVAAVDGAIPVHVDGGIRSGSDIFRALALGAQFVWIGRPVLWGLAYDGQRGVELVLEILQEELKICMSLAGCTSIKQINANYLGCVQGSHFENLGRVKLADGGIAVSKL